VAVAAEAAGLVARRRRELFAAGPAGAAAGLVRAKSTATDPVTVVDTESEELIRRRLAAARPGDGVLGEEGGGRLGEGPVTWIVDPIDGTVNFLYGIGAYAVSIAARAGGAVVAGAVADAAAGGVYSAALGGGARFAPPDGPERALAANPVAELPRALVGTGFAYRAERRRRQGALLAALLPRVRDVRRIGSAALDLCFVASGRLDAHYEHGLQPWDYAAGALIAAEAGAAVWAPPLTAPAAEGRLLLAAAPGIAEALRGELLALGGAALGDAPAG
jgi:myo-inositol-1(or 4)-monophosphatase